MDEFVRKHEARIHGVLSCFDRMLFRGYLPIMSGWSMAQLLKAHDIDCNSVKPFLLANAERVKAHAVGLARKHGRPFEYLGAKLRKEDAARKIAERDGIGDGLVCASLPSNRAARSPCASRRGSPSCSRPSAYACTFTTTSWIATWASSTFAYRPGSRCRFRSTSTATSGSLAN